MDQERAAAALWRARLGHAVMIEPERLKRAVKAISRRNGITASAHTPVVPDAARVGALPAFIRMLEG